MSYRRWLGLTTYNGGDWRFPKDNGIRWFRVHVRAYERWREIGGLWWQRLDGGFAIRILRPQRDGIQKPVSARKTREER
jgi:hypothetical protein